MSETAIPKPYQEGERVVVYNPEIGKRWHGFILEDKPPYKLLVQIDDTRHPIRVGRMYVRRDW